MRIAVFRTFDAARDFGAEHGRGLPAWRAVPFNAGWAVQVRPGGPYLASDGTLFTVCADCEQPVAPGDGHVYAGDLLCRTCFEAELIDAGL